MPTQEQLERSVADFERQYPDSLADRVKWWADVLGIDRTRLFRLLGLSGPGAARTPLAALPQVVESHEERAEMIDDMLGQLLASFDYDLPAFSAALRSPAPEEKSRVARRPGEIVPLPYTPGPHVRSGILLNEIVAGGPFALRALLAYIREGRTDRRRRRRRTN
jgi:hypothetical protein